MEIVRNRNHAFRAALALAAVVVYCALPQPADAAAKRGSAEPAPSLEPQATAALWRRLVDRPASRTFGVTAECRPLRAVFYTANDWLRLATKLAATPSPCAQYFVSVPALTSDKTRPRPAQASRIRALGPSFHALAEIHFTAWQRWVASSGASWYQAGVEARRRMAAAGYDVGAGDTWAVNELSSAVRRGDGSWRSDAREFLRGLFDAGGELPAARGVVFVVGVGQNISDLATYKARTQEWLQDTPFWVDMNAYVSDWSQEVYADVRGYAAPGAPAADRRDGLLDFLQHQTLLAAAGGASSGAANAFFTAAASPLANAAWQWGSGFGWTMVPYDLMQHFVSAQVYALRTHTARRGEPTDHWGFAWAPRNAEGLPEGEFAGQTGALLDRLAIAIRDSANGNPADRGAGACGPPAQNVWCAGDLLGAALSDRWRSFRTWSAPTLSFVSPQQSVVAGGVSAPITARLQIAGVASKPLAALPVTVSSSSPTGTFATSPSGPFTPTLTVTLAPGSLASPPVFFQDTRAGTVTLTAAGPGVAPATQLVTVTGAALLSLRVEPASTTLVLGTATTFTAVGTDAFGNAAPIGAAVWSLAPGTPGAVAPATGPSTTYTASGRPGTGAVVATVTTSSGPLSAEAPVTVTAPPALRVAAVRYGVAKRRLHVYVTVVNGRGMRVRGASVTVALYRNGKLYARAAGPTTRGRMTFDRPATWGAYRARVTRVAAAGHAWNGKTPRNAFTRAKPKPRAG